MQTLGFAALQQIGQSAPTAAAFPLQSKNGSQETFQPTLTLRSLLAGLSPPVHAGDVTFVDLPNPQPITSWTTLSADDLAGTDFTDSSYQPGLLATGSTIEYERPPRSSLDANAADGRIVSGTLDLYFHSGPKLTVTLKSSKGQAATVGGQKVVKVPLSAGSSPTLGTSAGPVTYLWTFGDGSDPVTTSTPTTTHAYPAQNAGWYANVTVRAAGNDSAGQSALTLVKADAKPTKGGSKPGAGNSKNPTAPGAGKTKGTGNHNGSSANPSGTGTTSGGTDATPVAPIAPTVRSVTPVGPATASTTGPTTDPTLSDRLPLVGGRVIAGGTVLPVAQLTQLTQAEQRAAAAPIPTAHEDGTPPWRISSMAVAVALLLVLFGAGAASELRPVRRKRVS